MCFFFTALETTGFYENIFKTNASNGSILNDNGTEFIWKTLHVVKYIT